MRFVLASASPVRRQLLLSAGLHPEVVVSGVDEEAITANSPAQLAEVLAEMKARAVAETVAVSAPTLVLGCDSVFELNGVAYGKPETPGVAIQRWRAMRGQTGALHTGHCLIALAPDAPPRQASRVCSAQVSFDAVTEDEIAAYVASGEPLHVAGGFMLEGRASAFITGVTGDPHTVMGLSVVTLRHLTAELGHTWREVVGDGLLKHNRLPTDT